MHLIYGEGTESFARLLEEIIRKYPDQSILASNLRYLDFLPQSPKDFSGSGHVVLSNSTKLQNLYRPAHQQHAFNMTNVGLQITLPLIPTLVPDIFFGALDCWDVDSAVEKSMRKISRIWIPLMRSGTPEASRFARLLYPEGFVSAQLHCKPNIPDTSSDTPSDTQSDTTDDEKKPRAKYFDLVGPKMHVDLLTKKPFATLMSIPPYDPSPAGIRSPLLLCFPRGLANYRLYGIYTNLDAPLKDPQSSLPSLTHARIPLIFPYPIEDVCGVPVCKVLVVFRARKSSLPTYVAIYLANFPDKKTNDEESDQGSAEFKPVCYVLPSWPPWSAIPEPTLRSLNLPDSLSHYAENGDVLVTVQATPCTEIERKKKGAATKRYVVLTQIVLDNKTRIKEAEAAMEVDSQASSGMFDYIGKEFSADDKDIVHSVREQIGKKRRRVMHASDVEGTEGQ